MLKVLKWRNEIYQRTTLKRVDKKIVFICLGVMFNSGAMVIKMSKMAHFLYFMLMAVKNQSQFEQNVQVHLKDLTYLLSKML